MRPCATPMCPVLVEKGHCTQHQQQLRTINTRYTKGNYGRPWRRLREQFLQQDYPWFCAIRGPHCEAPLRMLTKDEVEVDHIIPHRGDTTLRDDLHNLQVACRTCHSTKTAQESGWHTGP